MAPDSENTVYVVTGGNRGLGLRLVNALLTRPNITVFATVRSKQAGSALEADAANFSLGSRSTLHIVQLDFSDDTSPEKIREAFNIDHIDVLISNAGIATTMASAANVTAEDLRSTFQVNTIAPLMVFQGLWPLLQRSITTPKFILISSTLGSIEAIEPLFAGAYGPSKAAMNWLTKALHKENESSGLVAFALHPGWVQTRMGEFAAEEWAIASGPPTTLKSSINGMVKVIDGTTRDTVSGKFISYEGDVVPW